MDVTKLIFQHITPQVSDRIGTIVGRSQDDSASLMAAAVPAVLATLLGLTDDERLEDAVRRSPADGLRALAAADSDALDAASRGGLSRGDDLAGPSCFAAISAALEHHGGVDRTQARRISGLAMEFSVAGIADAGRAQGLDAREALSMFAGQIGSVALAIPGAFAEMLAERRLLMGLGDRASEASAEARPAGGATNRPGAPDLPAQPGPAWWRWIIPGVAIVVAVVIALTFLRAPGPIG